MLSPLNWTISNNELYALTSPADGVAKIGVICGYIINWDKDATSITDQYTYLAPFGGYVETKSPTWEVRKNFITTYCKYPEAALDLLLTIASPEGMRRQRYGVPGVDFEVGTAIDDGTPIVVVLNGDAYSGQTKQTWGQETVRIAWGITEGEEWKDQEAFIIGVTNPPEKQTAAEKRRLKHNAGNRQYMAAHKEYSDGYKDKKYTPFTRRMVPQVPEGIAAIVNIESPMLSFTSSTCNDFMTGKLDVFNDAEWNKYIQTLKDMDPENVVTTIIKSDHERSTKQGVEFNKIIAKLAEDYGK